MKSYTFKATPKDTDYQRICRENHQARFLVVRSEGIEPITFVHARSAEHLELLKSLSTRALGRIVVPPKAPVDGRTGQTWLIFEGDFSKELAPKVLTTVEVY
jgi:hypothetical protein